ncbi:hypothetical protein [Kluyvera ascorbata]|uniref:hypothetical protein n=1 Tax=Kluyvera TaxID=579 RepID=UPI0029002EE0|nr:hypothetical protein [Kluyvera ascorbata]MDU1197367.1 hypothetical protein [Kluyvera ascorbata]
MNDITALAQKIKASAIAVARDGRTDDEWFYYLQCVHHKNVLALVEALEKAQKSNQFLKDQLSELANFNPDWDKLEASYESWREIAAELLVAKDRIAELESRIVTVKLPTTRFWAGMIECYEKADVITAIREAGGEISND